MVDKSSIFHEPAVLDEDYILHLLQDSEPGQQTRRNRYSILVRLEHCIQRKYGQQYHLAIFGSVAYGLDSDLTDLDICVVVSTSFFGHIDSQGGLPNFHTDGTPYNLGNLAHRCIAKAGGFQIQRVIRNANTPIVILEDIGTLLPLDINVNCLAGPYNTLFLSSHFHQSPHFLLPLANYLKIWAKNRHLSGSSLPRSESISSYAILLLLLTYLVRINAVYDLLGDGTSWVDATLSVPRGEMDDRWEQAFATVGKGRLEMYGMKDVLEWFFGWLVDWEGSVGFEMMSLRGGGLVERTSTRKPESFMQVEDPFVLDRSQLDDASSRKPEGHMTYFQEETGGSRR
ncbi:hypothetical protein BDY24DRAFT_418946 [Mrakia frigida]|uniref:nucleotidyltransferase domain-containing protein n=1 Tax=Mrakia frigida TaxID=29902 RepID=UPI003FCBF44B